MGTVPSLGGCGRTRDDVLDLVLLPQVAQEALIRATGAVEPARQHHIEVVRLLRLPDRHQHHAILENRQKSDQVLPFLNAIHQVLNGSFQRF